MSRGIHRCPEEALMIDQDFGEAGLDALTASIVCLSEAALDAATARTEPAQQGSLAEHLHGLAQDMTALAHACTILVRRSRT